MATLRQTRHCDAGTNDTTPAAAHSKQSIDDQYPKPANSQLTEPSPRATPAVHSAFRLCYIIAGNFICSGIIGLCLWGFSKINEVAPWQKRVFNALSLLLSATLGFGIGFLFDRVGLLARGTLLQSRPHSVKEVGYIMRGTLSSYILLFMHRVHTWQGLVTSTTGVLVLFLLCSLVGRFGVAFLGFGFSLDDTLIYIPPLSRPDWRNGSISEGINDRILLAFARDLNLTTDISLVREYPGLDIHIPDYEMAAILFKNAQAVKGLPWFVQGRYDTLGLDSTVQLDRTVHLSYVIDFLHFSNVNLTMEVLGANKVSSRYKFRDFRGTTAVPAGWQALLETRCQDDQDNSASQGLNYTLRESEEPQGNYAWIINEVMPRFGSEIAKNATIKIWLIAYESLAFNCSISVDYGADNQPFPALESSPKPGLEVSEYILELLRFSLVLPWTQEISDLVWRDFYATWLFEVGLKGQDRELWLAAYIGNYIGNCLSYLNDILRRIELEPEQTRVRTQLSVKWGKIAATLGALAGFQLLFAFAAVLYCRGGLEIVDDVATFSSMFMGFPFPLWEKRQKETVGVVKQGKFVREADGVRLVFVAEEGKQALG